jgi:putative PIN family toxin of toxin-antitoxin system
VRIVLDTNILVRANPRTSPSGIAAELLRTVVSQSHRLILSLPILVEVERVLSYPHVQTRWPLTREDIDLYVAYLQSAGELVALPASHAAVVSDPDDDPILQTAIRGRANVLCTRDAAFKHPKVEEVCSTHGIRILDDIALMHGLRNLGQGVKKT